MPLFYMIICLDIYMKEMFFKANAQAESNQYS